MFLFSGSLNTVAISIFTWFNQLQYASKFFSPHLLIPPHVLNFSTELKVYTEHTNTAGRIFLFFFPLQTCLTKAAWNSVSLKELFFLGGPTWASGSLSTVCRGQKSLDFVTCDTQPVTTSACFTSKLPLTCSQPFLYRSCPSPQLSGSSAALLKSPPLDK